MKLVTSTLANKSYAYTSSATKVVASTAYSDFFVLQDTRNECGTPVCSLKISGCGSSYTAGNLEINSSTGQIKVKKNVDAGYEDTVCIQCTIGS